MLNPTAPRGRDTRRDGCCLEGAGPLRERLGEARGALPGVRAGRRVVMSTHASHYAAYGLCICSEIALPFGVAPPKSRPDVTIRFGPTPETLGASGERYGLWQSIPGAYLLDVDGVARYLVTGGREIVVEPTGNGDAAVSVFLLGSVLAACLQQRGIVTLHASAIETGGGAVLFAGVSGSGKSTLLAALVDRGYAMLADDVTGVVLGAGGRPVALSAFPCVRLWADAVDGLAWRGRTRGRVRDELEKYLAPVECFRKEPLAVGAVFTLASHNRDEFEIDLASRPVAFEQLLKHTYRMRAPARAGTAARPLPSRGRPGPAGAAHAREEARASLPARGAGGRDRAAPAGGPDGGRGPPACPRRRVGGPGRGYRRRRLRSTRGVHHLDRALSVTGDIVVGTPRKQPKRLRQRVQSPRRSEPMHAGDLPAGPVTSLRGDLLPWTKPVIRTLHASATRSGPYYPSNIEFVDYFVVS